MLEFTTPNPVTEKITPLVNAFAAAADNQSKAETLLALCNGMIEDRIGFPALRKAFPSSPVDKTMTQLSALVMTFTHESGHAFMPDKFCTQIIVDESDKMSLDEWGKLFIEVNMVALDKAVEHHYSTAPPALGQELIKQPNMAYAAFKKLWGALGLNI